MKNIDYKKLILYIVITIVIGNLPSIFIFNEISSVYDLINKPPLSPPGILFPIIWLILYILMGISYYIVIKKGEKYSGEVKLIYFLQLIINALWTPIFFYFKQYFLAFTWILMIIVLVIFMITKFYKIDKKAAYLQLPYIVWLIYAAYLNFGVFVLNS